MFIVHFIFNRERDLFLNCVHLDDMCKMTLKSETGKL